MLPLGIATEPSRLILTQHRLINGGGKRIGNKLQLMSMFSYLERNGFVCAFPFSVSL